MAGPTLKNIRDAKCYMLREVSKGKQLNRTIDVEYSKNMYHMNFSGNLSNGMHRIYYHHTNIRHHNTIGRKTNPIHNYDFTYMNQYKILSFGLEKINSLPSYIGSNQHHLFSLHRN